MQAKAGTRQTVIDRVDPVCIWQWRTLMSGDGYKRIAMPSRIGTLKIFHIQPAMKGGQYLVRNIFKKREVQQVNVKMQDIELASSVLYFRKQA
ncbi:hypothetical protein D3C73_1127350 [compost metagenome]